MPDPDLKQLICPVTGKLMRVGFVETIKVLSRAPAQYRMRSITRNVYVSQAGEAPVYNSWPKDVLPRSHSDNNLAENALSPLKIGAKNWLFIGHPDVGPRAAIMFTLVENCRQAKINPEAYFADVLACTDDLPASAIPAKSQS